MRFLVSTVLALAIVGANAFPMGAPPSVCNTMTPGHQGSVQQTQHNYRLDAQRTSNSEAQVMITGAVFKGFIIVAHDDAGLVTGNYGGAAVQQLPCGATHTNGLDKTDVVLTFKANRDFAGPVQFKATIVENIRGYAKDVTSNNV